MSLDKKSTVEKNEMFSKLMNVFNEHNENDDSRSKYKKMSFDENMTYEQIDEKMIYEQNDEKTIHKQNNEKSTHEQTNEKMIEKKIDDEFDDIEFQIDQIIVLFDHTSNNFIDFE